MSTPIPGRVVIIGGRTYTLVRSQVSSSQSLPATIVTVDTNNVPTDISGMNWRAPHTLISKSQNFQELGVVSGDRLLFDLAVPNTQISIEVPAQVVGVDRFRLGFILTDQQTPAGEDYQIPNATFLAIADALNISGVTTNLDGTLSFTGDALTLYNTVNSPWFKNQFFNKELTPFSTITVAGLDFVIRPKAIIRNKLLPLDPEVQSIPMLQEYIKAPDYIQKEDGSYVILHNDVEHPIPREPAYLGENVDYIIGDDAAFDGKLTFQTGFDTIDADTADFHDRGIEPGDTVSIIAPSSIADNYLVESVVGVHKIKLTRVTHPYLNQIGSWVTAHVKVTRSKAGHYLRLVPGKYTAANPAPNRLWAEVTFFNNNQAIEDNFGLLVGVTQRDLEKISTNATYRQVVAGLMYALTRGSAVSKIESGIKILLGLPYAEHDGIIRSIEKNYRLAPDGTPITGRILIEDIDSNGIPLGVVRVYTYPIDSSSDLSGIEVNPNTAIGVGQIWSKAGDPASQSVKVTSVAGNLVYFLHQDNTTSFSTVSSVLDKTQGWSLDPTSAVVVNEYVVGDTVYRLAPLAKGVKVTDYTTDPITDGSIATLLQQFQSFRVSVNNNIFSTDELGMVSSFLQKISPSYVAHILAISNSQEDTVSLVDVASYGVRLGNGAGFFADNTSLGLPYAVALDQNSTEGFQYVILGDEAFYRIRRSGKDLATTLGGSGGTSAGAGFLNARTNESFDAPLCAIGDTLLILRGDNKGEYPISAITDGSVTVTGAPSVGFQAATGQFFTIMRKVKSLISTRPGIVVTSGSSSIPLGSGLVTDGVMVGDWLIPNNGTLARRFLITSIPKNVGNGHFDSVTVTPTPAVSVTTDFIVVRPQLLESPWPTNFTVTTAGVDILTETTGYLRGLADVRDELVFPDGTAVTILNPTKRVTGVNYICHGSLTLGGGTYSVQLRKAGRTAGPIDMNTLENNNPADSVDVMCGHVSTSTAVCTNGSSVVSGFADTSWVKPGDFLVLIGGTNGTVDVGFGNGVYPIYASVGANITLTISLTATETLPWTIKRTR